MQLSKENDPSVTAFAIDRILWLIGSGDFYKNKEVKFTDSKNPKERKEDFCSKVKGELAKAGF